MPALQDLDFPRRMSARPTSQLLDLLRAQHDYVPEAVQAAREELMRREVSGFDISAADDEATHNQAQRLQRDQGMPTWEIILWTTLPILAATPLGRNAFHRHTRNGHTRRALQVLECATVGFVAYGMLIPILHLIGLF